VPIYSFPPIAEIDARLLILGTMPGKISLAQQQYYAHPRNAFWPIMGELLGFDARVDYAERTAQLLRADIAVWDVLQSCIRSSSLDADIDMASEVANDFAEFLARHGEIRRIGFNGAKAAQLFRRHVLKQLPPSDRRELEFRFLPSTSPAHAGMNFETKLQAWRQILD